MNRILLASIASASILALGACAGTGEPTQASAVTSDSVAGAVRGGADPKVVEDAALDAGGSPQAVREGIAAGQR